MKVDPCAGLGLVVSAACLATFGAAAAPHDAVFDTVQPPAKSSLYSLADSTPMSIVLSLPMRDPAGAQGFAAAVSQPGNKLYGKFITPVEFGDLFGGDAANYEYLRNWAAAHGLTVGERMDARTSLPLEGTAAQFAHLFNTSFARFETAEHGDGQVTLTPPRLPAELVGRINGVVGLQSAGRYGLLMHKKQIGLPDVGTGLGGGYAPTDLRTAYAVPAQLGGKTEVIGLFEQGGYFRGDISMYQKHYTISVSIKPRSVNGSSTNPIANGVDVEAALDIDAASAVNPALSQITVYEDGKDAFGVALVNSFNAMAQDSTAKVISVSYGQDESMQGAKSIEAENTALTQLATQGQTVFISAGDNGAAGRGGSGLNAPDPGSQPLVTSVGGTHLNTQSTNQAFASETVWNDLSVGFGATGGGVSSVWSIPNYQVVRGKSVAVANGGSATMRNVPDIAADADPVTACSIYSSSQGGWIAVGGTSLAAPLWAGFASIINAARVNAGSARLGFFNPLLYKVGLTEKGFHDIKLGNNGNPGFNAGKGYDNTTGFGSVNLTKLLPTVTK